MESILRYLFNPLRLFLLVLVISICFGLFLLSEGLLWLTHRAEDAMIGLALRISGVRL